MKKLLFLVIILFISISAVSATENLTDFIGDDSNNFVCGDSDEINVPLENLNGEGSDNPALADEIPSEEGSGAEVLNDSDITIKGTNLVRYVKSDSYYKFRIVDSNGAGVAVKNVSVTLNKKTTLVDTNNKGYGYLHITGLKAGKYPITVKYKGHKLTKKVKLFASKIKVSNDISTVYGKKAKFSIKLIDKNGNPIANKKVIFTTDVKKYKRFTDKYGFARIWLNYVSGKYSVKYEANGLTAKTRYIVNNYVSLKILDWGLKGYVAKAPLIKNNMPDNIWVKKAVQATKNGLPFITIKGGNKNVVFMTAGVHGNELNSQVAAMKMIKYLTEHPIKGTVYIIPFVNVKAISQKVRLTDYDFNRVAADHGTVSNKIINLIMKKNCDAYGDFHTTVSPGVPGINVVLGYTSTEKCISLTNYIAKNANVDKIFYYPGEKYTWSLADYSNLLGTPAVICEVISPVNEVSAGATKLSFSQMTQFLKFNKIV